MAHSVILKSLEPTHCENDCGSEECDEYWGGTGWVCQECRNDLEEQQEYEEYDGQPDEAQEWEDFSPGC